mgnify:CR=1 FL=1
MNTEEKLKHFKEICESDVRIRAEKLLSEQRETLESRFAAHREAALHHQSMQLQLEEERIAREQNKEYSLKLTELRRELGELRRELKDQLFVELRDRLANFMETPAYLTLLKKQISAAKEFAGEDEIRIYLDPADEPLLKKLSLALSTELTLSRYSFLGGTRAVIPAKNILIDNSFETKLEDARASFRFTLESEHGGEAQDE